MQASCMTSVLSILRMYMWRCICVSLWICCLCCSGRWCVTASGRFTSLSSLCWWALSSVTCWWERWQTGTSETHWRVWGVVMFLWQCFASQVGPDPRAAGVCAVGAGVRFGRGLLCGYGHVQHAALLRRLLSGGDQTLALRPEWVWLSFLLCFLQCRGC